MRQNCYATALKHRAHTPPPSRGLLDISSSPNGQPTTKGRRIRSELQASKRDMWGDIMRELESESYYSSSRRTAYRSLARYCCEPRHECLPTRNTLYRVPSKRGSGLRRIGDGARPQPVDKFARRQL